MANYTKEEIRLQGKIKELIANKNELERLLEIRNNDVLKLKKQVVTLQAEITTKTSDKDVVKKILSLYAKNNSHAEIFDKMKYKGYREVSLDYVKEICDNREELESDLVLYFKEQEKAYEEQLKINPDIYKDKLMSRLERMYNLAEYRAGMCETDDETRKWITNMKDLIKEQNSVLKNMVDDKDNETTTTNIINDMMQDYEDQKSKIIKFNISDLKTI